MRLLPSLACVVGLTMAADNGKALTPPMGWRSWNCYGGDVDQGKMESIMDRMAEKKRMVGGTPTSLADLGYTNCGLDDNWQACGDGVQQSFHDDAGYPLLNTKSFPDMKSMTDYGHAKGLFIGWYMNNCICSENQFKDEGYIAKHMEQSVKAIIDFGYDGVKLDGCGQFKNLTWWYDLINATSQSILIENCHWGNTVPGGQGGQGDWAAPCSGTTDISDCPYNFFRTSGDIRNNWKSMFSNLQTSIKFQGNPPLSRPGTWAYPDMMEVGRMASYEEDRTHFGAWVITSSPLILGYDLNDDTVTDKVWPIISNTEAIAINQQWAGHPGRLVKSFHPGPTPPSVHYVEAHACGKPNQTTWSYDAQSSRVKGPGGLCLDYTDSSQLELKTCGSTTMQAFTYGDDHTLKTVAAAYPDVLQEAIQRHPEKAGVMCLDVYDFTGPVVELYNCNGGPNQQFDFQSDGTLTDRDDPKLCLTSTESPGNGGFQMWAKKQAKGAEAVLVFNGEADTSFTSAVNVSFADLSLSGPVHVRDVWAQHDLGTFTGMFPTEAIKSHDSVLLLLTPA